MSEPCAGAAKEESENVEDRRDEGGGFPFPGGGVGFPSGGSGRGGGIGILGILIILGLMFFFGVDPSVILQGGPPSGGSDPNFPGYSSAAIASRHHWSSGAGEVRHADRASADLASRRSQAIRLGRARRHRGCVERHLHALRRRYERPQVRAVHRRHALACGMGWRRWGRSIAPTTRRSISTSDSTRS